MLIPWDINMLIPFGRLYPVRSATKYVKSSLAEFVASSIPHGVPESIGCGLAPGNVAGGCGQG